MAENVWWPAHTNKAGYLRDGKLYRCFTCSWRELALL